MYQSKQLSYLIHSSFCRSPSPPHSQLMTSLPMSLRKQKPFTEIVHMFSPIFLGAPSLHLWIWPCSSCLWPISPYALYTSPSHLLNDITPVSLPHSAKTSTYPTLLDHLHSYICYNLSHLKTKHSHTPIRLLSSFECHINSNSSFSILLNPLKQAFQSYHSIKKAQDLHGLYITKAHGEFSVLDLNHQQHLTYLIISSSKCLLHLATKQYSCILVFYLFSHSLVSLTGSSFSNLFSKYFGMSQGLALEPFFLNYIPSLPRWFRPSS